MSYTVITLSGSYRESGSRIPQLPGSGGSREFRLDRFLEQVDRLLSRNKLPVVLIHRTADFSIPPFCAPEELYAQFKKLADRGAELWYYADSYTMIDCYLSSLCRYRCIQYLGTITFRGIARSGLFFTKALAAHGITVEVFRQGNYKSAAAGFTEEQFDSYDREQWEALLDCTVGHLAARTASGAGFSRELVDDLLSGTRLTAEQGVQRGIIHRITTYQQLCSYWKDEKRKLKALAKPRGKWNRGLMRRNIALLFLEGMVMDGRDRNSPLFGQVLGEEPFVKTVKRLADCRRVKAVVLRINSGGGSAYAHEHILRALEMLAQKKPLIITMGPVAASGGYWITGAGRSLLAGETTLTGSIGVVSMYLKMHAFLQSKGITTDTIKHGPFSDEGTSLRDMTREEQEDIEGVVRQIYRTFIRRTAASRRIDEQRAEQLAGGRIWSGRDACEQGLVDEVGTLGDALKLAAEEAGRGPCSIKVYPKVSVSLLHRLILRGSSLAGLSSLGMLREAVYLTGKPLLLDLQGHELSRGHLPLDI